MVQPVTHTSGENAARSLFPQRSSETAFERLISNAGFNVSARPQVATSATQTVRATVLKAMKLTENAIAAMPAKQRTSVERAIAAEIARRTHQKAAKS